MPEVPCFAPTYWTLAPTKVAAISLCKTGDDSLINSMLLEALLLPNNLDFGLLDCWSWLWVVNIYQRNHPRELWSQWERVWSPATTSRRAWQRFRALSAEQEKSAMHQRGMSFRIVELWCEQWAPTADGALLFKRLRGKSNFGMVLERWSPLTQFLHALFFSAVLWHLTAFCS